jgi:hypothetical protein
MITGIRCYICDSQVLTEIYKNLQILLKKFLHLEVLFSHDRKKIFLRGRNMYFTTNQINLSQFLP